MGLSLMQSKKEEPKLRPATDRETSLVLQALKNEVAEANAALSRAQLVFGVRDRTHPEARALHEALKPTARFLDWENVVASREYMDAAQRRENAWDQATFDRLTREMARTAPKPPEFDPDEIRQVTAALRAATEALRVFLGTTAQARRATVVPFTRPAPNAGRPSGLQDPDALRNTLSEWEARTLGEALAWVKERGITSAHEGRQRALDWLRMKEPATSRLPLKQRERYTALLQVLQANQTALRAIVKQYLEGE